jgi:hypothetical protein
MKKRTAQNFRRLAWLSFLLVSFSFAKAQILDSVLAVYSSKYQQERTYLHYDKTAYTAGETIWFKAYLMQGIMPAEGSKTLYVDWVDDKGNLLNHTSSPVLDGGVTNGQFDVPENYKGSFIHVRAYTKWMLNFDTAFLYRKNIRIIPTAVTPPATLPTAITTINFFPEGGDLVAGIKNKIAFKANDQWGRPVRVRGVIQKNGAVVDSLKTHHDGMGFFFLIPEGGAKYTVKWKDPKSKEQVNDLPTVRPSGISMQIGIASGKRYFTINRTADAAENLQRLHLVGTMQQTMVFKANANLSTNVTSSGVIPVESLPTGILTITVFDNNWNAIAERITHVNNDEYFFPMEMTVQKWGLSKRGRNEIELQLPPEISANLSVSVTDAFIESDSSNNIVSQFLLSGDLKGEVYRPSYYFKNNSDTITQQLDLVMLTHGWRRFKWEEITKGKFPTITYPKDTTYQTLSGKLFGLSPGQLQSGGSIVMMVKEKDSAAKMVVAPVARDGSFNTPDYVFFDSLRVYFQPSKPLQGSSVSFMTSRLAALNYGDKNFAGTPFFPDTTGYHRHALLAAEAAAILEQWKGKLLEEVTVTAQRKPTVQVLDEKYTTGLFKGFDALQFDVLNDPFANSAQNIFNYLQGKVAGLQITTGAGTPSLQWRGGAPLIYLDENATDPSMISGIPVQDIAYVKVFRPIFMGSGSSMYGSGANGAIAIYTRKGGDATSKPGTGLSANTVAGYSPIREFYSPNYSTFVRSNEQRDVRTTLYWQPQIITTGKNNKITLVFYNTDVFSKALRIVVEGMSADGQLTHMEQLIE